MGCLPQRARLHELLQALEQEGRITRGQIGRVAPRFATPLSVWCRSHTQQRALCDVLYAYAHVTRRPLPYCT